MATRMPSSLLCRRRLRCAGYLLLIQLASFIHSIAALSSSFGPKSLTGTNNSNSQGSSSSLDVILSSGFLCFSRHVGFAYALSDAGILGEVDRFVGTSSGALACSMLAAGLVPSQVEEELGAVRRPILAAGRPSYRPWRGGLLSTRGLRKRLERVLPPTFEDLKKPLAVGVFDVKTGKKRLVTSGPLLPAVAASAAVPFGMFEPVKLDDGKLYADGGAVDRTFVQGWRDWRATSSSSSSSSSSDREHHHRREALVHLITSEEAGIYTERDGIVHHATSGGDERLTVVHSPRTKATLWSLGNFEAEVMETRADTISALTEAGWGKQCS